MAQLKADIEAQRRIEAKRDDQAAAAARRQADQVPPARRKQEAVAAANRTATAKPALSEEAETVESRLHLELADRQRLQIALTLVGFDTGGRDGVFGPRSREMIANWQTARNQRPTGFMTRAQQQALLKEAATTLSTYDEQKKADAIVRTVAETSEPPTGRVPESADGLWRGTYECRKSNGNFVPFTLKPEVRLKDKGGTWYMVHPSWTNDQISGISISIDGTNVLVTRQGYATGRMPLSGHLTGNSIQAASDICTMVLTRDVSPVRAGRQAGPATVPAL